MATGKCYNLGLLHLVRLCLSLFGTCGATSSVAMYVYTHRSQMNEYVIGVPYVCCGLSLIIGFLSLVTMKTKFEHLLRSIDDNIFTYSYEKYIHVEYPWALRESSAGVVHFFFVVNQFIGYVPCFFPLFDHFVLKKSKSLSFPSWTPWNPEEHFIISLLVQLVLGFSACWLMFITQLFIVFVVIEFSRQNLRLCSALSTVDKRAKELALGGRKYDGNELTKDRHENCCENLLAEEFESNLKQCVQHHQKLMKLFHIFKSWFSILFFAELLADSLTFAAVFYNLFQTNTEVAYSALIGSSYIFINSLFIKTIVGEIFSDMNEKIATVIFYEVRWYEHSLSNRKLLSIFHSQVRRPMDLYAFSIFKASFFTFTSLIKTSYSYLNILKASFSSKN